MSSNHVVGMRVSDKEPLNMLNMKPYRTASQKEEARANAKKGKDGTWHSTAPVSHHVRPKDA